MGPCKSIACSLCGILVNRRGRSTSEHHHGGKRCLGSDMAYAAHAQPREICLVALSPFRATLARLRGHSVTFVDFRAAREQRALGHVTERAHALRFIRMEVRDVSSD